MGITVSYRFSVFTCALLLFAGPSYAQCIAGLPCVVDASADPATGPNADKAGGAEGCDADFMNQIYARAYMEVEREVGIAGQNIRKPDSVLQYSCYDTAAKDGLEAYNPIFSASTAHNGDIDKTARYNDLVKPSVDGYISADFDHNLIGGVSAATYSAESSPCDYISAVQALAQCADFDTAGAQFYDFNTLAETSFEDIRTKPDGNFCGGNGIDQDILDVANNEGFQYVRFDEFDDYFPIVYGDPDVPADQFCRDPVPTGVMIEAPVDSSWAAIGSIVFGARNMQEHKVCVNALCTYDRAADECVMR